MARTGGEAMEDEIPEDHQSWTAKRRVALVASILKGETSVQEAARKHGLTLAKVEEWKKKFLLGGCGQGYLLSDEGLAPVLYGMISR
jgi:transposase-like protein